MNTINEYSFIWEEERDKYVLLDDEYGISILSIDEEKMMFFLVEDETLVEEIVSKMKKNGNKIFNSVEDLKRTMGID